MNNDEDLVKRVVRMIEALRSLGGSDSLYIFTPFFKPVDVSMDTIFGAIFNFADFRAFSENKVQGFKKIVNDNQDILSGYIRIGDSVYKAELDHEYKTLPASKGRELIKSLVSRAVKVGKFDLSMMDPSWLKDSAKYDPTKAEPEHIMHEADEEPAAETEDGSVSYDLDGYPIYDNLSDAFACALEDLESVSGPYEYTEDQLQALAANMQDSQAPYTVKHMNGELYIIDDNNTGVILCNDNGQLHWEF